MPVLSCLRPAADAPVAMDDEDEYPTARRARAFSRLGDAPALDTSDFAILPYDVICHVLRFALAEHKASCVGEAGFVPSHTLARTPPARAVASSFPTTDQQESPIGLRGLRSLQRAQPDDAELASLEPLTWSPLRAEEYVSQTLGLPRVGSLLARRHVNGATLAAMSRTDQSVPSHKGSGWRPRTRTSSSIS